MEFRILGPLEVRDGDRAIPLGGPRQRAVLAILLTRANEVVGQEALIELLWGGEAPTRSATVLQGYVSHLRKALGPGVLVTRSPGYAIEIDEEQLDLHRFEALSEQARRDTEAGRAEEAAGSLRQAIALWRGPALADFTYEGFAQPEIARLEELRVVALERRIEAELTLGRSAELVGELEGLVAKHPLRERLCELLMLALYRSGRQADALEAYRATRRLLVDELGIDPGETLQELERAILRHDPALDRDAAREPSPGSEPAPERSIVVLPLDEEFLDALLAVAEPLATRPPRELIVVRLVTYEQELGEASARLRERRSSLRARGLASRTAAFTSAAPGADAVVLASEQNAGTSSSSMRLRPFSRRVRRARCLRPSSKTHHATLPCSSIACHSV